MKKRFIVYFLRLPEVIILIILSYLVLFSINQYGMTWSYWLVTVCYLWLSFMHINLYREAVRDHQSLKKFKFWPDILSMCAIIYSFTSLICFSFLVHMPYIEGIVIRGCVIYLAVFFLLLALGFNLFAYAKVKLLLIEENILVI